MLIKEPTWCRCVHCGKDMMPDPSGFQSCQRCMGKMPYHVVTLSTRHRDRLLVLLAKGGENIDREIAELL